MCRHVWVIESPHGSPTVAGQCRLCKEERIYQAGFHDDEFKPKWTPKAEPTHVYSLPRFPRRKKR